MNPYAEYPNLAELPISELTKGFRVICLQSLEKGWSPESMLAEVDDLVQKEQYELAQAIVDSVAAFRANPQLGLFA